MEIETLQVGQLNANCYLVYDENSKEAIIIDPGEDTEYITSEISKLNINPRKIIATHGHSDHVLSAGELQLIYGIDFLIHKKDKFLVKRLKETIKKYYQDIDMFVAPSITRHIKQGGVINIGNQNLKVIDLPGHTPGSIGLHLEELNICFVGDVVFADGFIGRTDFHYSSSEDLSKSIDKLKSFPEETVFYPGHGTEFSNIVLN
ncbi:MBL fold metallo-hydrolase [Patescibacteria group bacterium]